MQDRTFFAPWRKAEPRAAIKRTVRRKIMDGRGQRGPWPAAPEQAAGRRFVDGQNDVVTGQKHSVGEAHPANPSLREDQCLRSHSVTDHALGNPRHQLLSKSTDAPGRKQGPPRDKAPQITEKHLSAGPQLRVEQHATEERPGKAREKSFTESVAPQHGPGRKGFLRSPGSEGLGNQTEQTEQVGPGDDLRS